MNLEIQYDGQGKHWSRGTYTCIHGGGGAIKNSCKLVNIKYKLLILNHFPDHGIGHTRCCDIFPVGIEAIVVHRLNAFEYFRPVPKLAQGLVELCAG